jgi:hypothetical protein
MWIYLEQADRSDGDLGEGAPVNSYESVDIDEPFDFSIAETSMTERLKEANGRKENEQ